MPSANVAEQFIDYYNEQIQQMWDVTAGGTLRSLKGKLVVKLCEDMVEQAWNDIGGSIGRLSFPRQQYPIEDEDGNRYNIAPDKHVYIDGHFKMSIECKAYTEVAMYKRIMVDCLLLKSEFPDLEFHLFQLESMLGGDYAENPAHPKGSPSVNVLNHFFLDKSGVRIEIVTLLDGKRYVKRPIHKRDFYKPMRRERVEYAIRHFEKALSKYL